MLQPIAVQGRYRHRHRHCTHRARVEGSWGLATGCALDAGEAQAAGAQAAAGAYRGARPAAAAGANRQPAARLQVLQNARQ